MRIRMLLFFWSMLALATAGASFASLPHVLLSNTEVRTVEVQSDERENRSNQRETDRNTLLLHDSQLVFSTAIREEQKFEALLEAIPALNTEVAFDFHYNHYLSDLERYPDDHEKHEQADWQNDERFNPETLRTRLPARDVLMFYAEYASINPLVLLSILEMKSGILTKSGPITEKELERVAGFPEPVDAGFEKQLNRLTGVLFEHYYGAKYGEFTTITYDPALNPGSFAVLSVLAVTAGEPGLATEKIDEWGAGFVSIYQRYGNPLEDISWRRSKDDGPSATYNQPYMELPWAAGDSWHFTGGPHNYRGDDISKYRPWSSLDFAPPGGSGCGWTSYQEIRPARAGSVYHAENYLVKIGHRQEVWEEPWATSYLHVRNMAVSNGQWVTTSTRLGYPSCYGGNATGVHQHFSFLYDGQFVNAHGLYLSDWYIRETTHYNGTMTKGSRTVTANATKSDANRIMK